MLCPFWQAFKIIFCDINRPMPISVPQFLHIMHNHCRNYLKAKIVQDMPSVAQNRAGLVLGKDTYWSIRHNH